MTNTRAPAVAGAFYPAAPAVLGATVRQLLGAAPAHAMTQPKAMIVPHAGYVYSGSTAAEAYAVLEPWRTAIHRVVLLGPTHRIAVEGLALPRSDAFATPLGNVRIDKAAVAKITGMPQVVFSDPAHAQEHSLEVHLPFLQEVLDDFSLLPLAVGRASPEAVAEVLDCLWGGPETLIIVSSDLSHFLPYARAKEIDRDTCQHILQLDTHLRPEQACGAAPLNGLLLAASQRSMTARLLRLCNSGDTAGDKSRVVGYAAFTLHDAEHA